MAVGIKRIRDGWATQHSVIVRYPDGQEMEIPQDRYESERYQPPFNQLPWSEGEQDA